MSAKKTKKKGRRDKCFNIDHPKVRRLQDACKGGGGGIEELARALPPAIDCLHLQATAQKLGWRRERVADTVKYESLWNAAHLAHVHGVAHLLCSKADPNYSDNCNTGLLLNDMALRNRKLPAPRFQVAAGRAKRVGAMRQL